MELYVNIYDCLACMKLDPRLNSLIYNAGFQFCSYLFYRNHVFFLQIWQPWLGFAERNIFQFFLLSAFKIGDILYVTEVSYRRQFLFMKLKNFFVMQLNTK